MSLPAVAMNDIPTPRLVEEFPPAELPAELQAALKAPLPPEAVTQHPTKKFLSSIKPAFVIERMNDVFGIGAYKESYREISVTTVQKDWEGERGSRKATLFVATVHGTLTIRKYGIHLENFGGSENEDAGDALKGACTDAFTKMCSHLGIGLDVYKGRGHEGQSESLPACPNCGKQLRKSKDKDEFYCWTKKDGCGATFTPEALKKIAEAGAKRPAASERQQQPEKITIHGRVSELRQENQTLWFKTGTRVCASKNPEIMRRMFGGNGKLAELLVSEISVKNSPVFQVHKVIGLRTEREAAGYETV